MPPKISANNTNLSSNASENHTSHTDSHNQAYYVQTLRRIVRKMAELENAARKAATPAILQEMANKLVHEEISLKDLISNANAHSANLFIEFLRNIAFEIRNNIDLICQVVAVFAEEQYFVYHPEKIEEVHHDVINLIANLDLLNPESSQQRRKLLSLGTYASGLTIVKLQKNTVAEEKDNASIGEPGLNITAETATETGEQPEGETSDTNSHFTHLPTEATSSINLIDHYIRELKRKNAEVLYSLNRQVKKANELAQEQFDLYEKDATQKSKSSHTVSSSRSKNEGFDQTVKIIGELNEQIKNHFQPENWVSCLNDFVDTYQLTPNEIRVLFARLQQNDEEIALAKATQRIKVLTAHQYFPELLIRFIDNNEKTAELIQAFLYANKRSFSETEWIIQLFSGIYQIQQKNTYITESKLYQIATAIMAQIKLDAVDQGAEVFAEIALIPLLNLWEQHSKLHNAKIPLQAFAYQWLNRDDVDCFRLTGRQQSFFNSILLLWSKEAEKNQRMAPREFTLHGMNQDHAVYQVSAPAELHESNDKLTYYVMLTQLTPVVDNKAEFLKRCLNLFAHAGLKPDEMESLHQQFVARSQLPPANPERLQPFKDALIHRIHKERLDWDDMDLVKLLALLAPGEVATIYHDQYQPAIKYRSLVPKNDFPEGHVISVALLENASGNIADRYPVLIPVKTLQPNSTAALQVMYSHFLQVIANSSRYEQIERIPYFDSVPVLLMRLLDSKRQAEVLGLLLDDGDHANDAKGNAFCRAFISQGNMAESKDDLVETPFQQLAPRLSHYQHLPYYQLGILNIRAEFYESFNDAEHRYAQSYILKFGKNPDFRNLYTWSNGHPTPADTFIRLIGIPNLRETVIDEKVLSYLSWLQLAVYRASNEEAELFKVLRSLILNYDHDKADQNNLITVLGQINNIFCRFNSSEHKEKLAAIVKIKKAIQAKDANQKLENLQTIINGMKDEFPMAEDLAEKLTKDSTHMLKYLSRLQLRLNTRTLEYNLPQLEELITYISRQSNDNQKALLKVLLYGETSYSRVNLIAIKTSNNKSWLEFAWDKQCILLCYELLDLGADECAEFSIGSDKSFIHHYLDTVRQKPEILKNLEWRNVLVFLFTKKNYKTKSTLTNWLLNQAASNSSLEEKESDKRSVAANISTFIGQFFQYIDAKYLPDIALAFIQADRFDLLNVLNTIYKKATGRDIYSDENSKHPLPTLGSDFDTNIRQVLNLSAKVPYQQYMRLPLFYTTYNRLLPLFYTTNPDLNIGFLNLALAANLDEPYTAIMGDQFVASIRGLIKKQLIWKESENTQTLYLYIMSKLGKAVRENNLSLNEMIRLLDSVTDLDLPPHYPIINALEDIFTTHSKEWHNRIEKLHTDFSRFKIEQRNPVDVKKEFQSTKPSFNDVIVKSGPTDTIEYFYQVFANTTRMVASFPEKANWNDTASLPSATQTEILAIYKNTTPGEWNLNNDSKYFASMVLISNYTMKKKPYHAQFFDVMGAMYAVPVNTVKLLMDVSTNGGKTSIIAWTIACLVKTYRQHHAADPSLIAVETLTNHLARENAQENKPFYDALGISSGSDINANTLVRYTTGLDLLFKKVADDIAPAFHDEAKIDRSNWMLIMDETDVPLSDRRKKFVRAAGYGEIAKQINPILKMIWKIVNSIDRSDETIKATILASPEYSKMLPFLQEHLLEDLANFTATARTVKNDGKIIRQHKTAAPSMGATETVEKETGIIAENSIGRYGQPQFRQMKMYGDNIALTDYEMAHDTVYHSDVINDFSIKIGLSGTLGSKEERQEYHRDGYITVNTAKPNAQNLTKLNDILCDSEDEWNATVYRTAKERAENGQPALIFFESIEAVERFYETYFAGKEGGKVNLFLGKESPERYNQIVLEATEGGTITLATIIGGRGVDFKLHNTLINEKGGLFIIIAAVIDAYNVYLQLLARTARGNNNGTAISILLRATLEMKLRNNFVSVEDLSQDNFNQKIEELRKAVLKNRFTPIEEEKKRNYSWRLSQNFYQNVLPKGINKVHRLEQYQRFLLSHSLADKRKVQAAVEKYNSEFKQEIELPRTLINVVLVLDVSGSMRNTLESAKQKLAELPRAIAKSSPGAVLQVAVVSYSDYEDESRYNSNRNVPEYWLNNDTDACRVRGFTNVENALSFLNSLSLLNGYDSPEAMELALYKTNQLNWPLASNGNRVMRQVFIVSDSLPHGSGAADDHFPEQSNPAKLSWTSEAAALKSRGVEIHMIACNGSNHDKYLQLAGKDGSVTNLNDANTLIEKMVNKVQQGDEIDTLISDLNEMCVSQQISQAEVRERLAHAMTTSMGVDGGDAHEVAQAKLLGFKMRNQ
jgi:translation initiation factor 2 beta subunit (eIF-2beta)/eIF-5